MQLVEIYFSLLKRDLILAYRKRSELANPVIFFVIITALFPLATGTDKEMLRTLAPGIVWVSALLATLLSLESIFRSDFDDGALEQLILSPWPVSILIIAKITAHWLVTGLPLIIISPFMALSLGLPESAISALIITLLLGTPVLSLIGSIGVALTVGLRRGGLLMSLLLLPLYIPVLIFGTSAVGDVANGMNITGQLYIMGALLVLALTLSPIASVAALRISLN